MTKIDAALRFAFLDIEVAFEIVVFYLFGDFSKATQVKGDLGVGSPMKLARQNKTNMGAGEIDPVQAGCGVEIWRAVKAQVSAIDCFRSW